MEVITALITFIVAAATGILYDWLLKSRQLKPKESEVSLTKSEARTTTYSARFNLPPSSSTIFVGRQNEIRHLLDLLSPDNSIHLIGVHGIGGVGKTALALEVAKQCTDTGLFDAVIWVSAKQSILTPDGISPRQASSDMMEDIISTISFTLDYPGILQAEPSAQPLAIKAVLARQRTLLIVDNLETATDKEKVISFLYELPLQSKAIVTSRERLQLPATIQLFGLNHAECSELIAHELKRNGIDYKYVERDIPKIYSYAAGVPLTIKWIVASLSVYSLDSILRRLNEPDGDVARFTLESSIAQLRDKPAHRLLLSLALLPNDSSAKKIALVSGLNDTSLAEDGFVQLQRLSLIDRSNNGFSIHPLVRQYAMSEIERSPDFEREARERVKA